jgi:hypothetical protein
MFKAIKEFFAGKPAPEPVATPRAEEAPYKIETPAVAEAAPVTAEAAPAVKKSAPPRAKKPAVAKPAAKPAAKKPAAPRKPRTPAA